MKISDIIIEPKIQRFGLNEVGMAHAEDIIFYEGSAGALRVINSFKTLPKQRDQVLTIKWDGQVALFAGRDESGAFIMTDVAGWNAKGYNGLYKSIDELLKQKRNKGGNEEFLAKVKELWPVMETAFPPAYRGFVMGDVMWWVGNLKENNGKWAFGEGTTTYEIDKNSDIGHRVGQGDAGFAVHGYCATTNDKEPTLLKNTAGLNLNGRLCVLGPEIKVEGDIQVNKGKIKEATQFIKAHAKLIDSFLNVETLKAAQMTGLPNVLYTFVNQQTRNRDLADLNNKFIGWVQQNPKLTKPMVQKIITYCQSNAEAVKAIFTAFDIVTALKLDIIHQLDSHSGPIYAHIKGERGGEGYVNADPGGHIKYVDRMHFTATNFANH